MRRLFGIVDQSESCWIRGQFSDGEAAIPKVYIQTLTGTLFAKSTRRVINGRSGQDLLDANGGKVFVDGAFEVALQPADNAIVENTQEGQAEIHVLRLTWTWNDGGTVRTGIEELEFAVRRLAVTV